MAYFPTKKELKEQIKKYNDDHRKVQDNTIKSSEYWPQHFVAVHPLVQQSFRGATAKTSFDVNIKRDDLATNKNKKFSLTTKKEGGEPLNLSAHWATAAIPLMPRKRRPQCIESLPPGSRPGTRGPSDGQYASRFPIDRRPFTAPMGEEGCFAFDADDEDFAHRPNTSLGLVRHNRQYSREMSLTSTRMQQTTRTADTSRSMESTGLLKKTQQSFEKEIEKVTNDLFVLTTHPEPCEPDAASVRCFDHEDHLTKHSVTVKMDPRIRYLNSGSFRLDDSNKGSGGEENGLNSLNVGGKSICASSASRTLQGSGSVHMPFQQLYVTEPKTRLLSDAEEVAAKYKPHVPFLAESLPGRCLSPISPTRRLDVSKEGIKQSRSPSVTPPLSPGHVSPHQRLDQTSSSNFSPTLSSGQNSGHADMAVPRLTIPSIEPEVSNILPSSLSASLSVQNMWESQDIQPPQLMTKPLSTSGSVEPQSYKPAPYVVHSYVMGWKLMSQDQREWEPPIQSNQQHTKSKKEAQRILQRNIKAEQKTVERHRTRLNSIFRPKTSAGTSEVQTRSQLNKQQVSALQFPSL